LLLLLLAMEGRLLLRRERVLAGLRRRVRRRRTTRGRAMLLHGERTRPLHLRRRHVHVGRHTTSTTSSTLRGMAMLRRNLLLLMLHGLLLLLLHGLKLLHLRVRVLRMPHGRRKLHCRRQLPLPHRLARRLVASPFLGLLLLLLLLGPALALLLVAAPAPAFLRR
jgi:hypothetical protein